jgi:hypothetical protein
MKRSDRLWLSFTRNGRALKRGLDSGEMTVDRTPLAKDPNPPDTATTISVSKRGVTVRQWTPQKRRTHRRVELGLLWVALGFGLCAFWFPGLIGFSFILLAVAYMHIRNGIGMGTPFLDVTTPEITIDRRPE